MKVKYTFNENHYEEIKAARKKNRDKQIDRRLLVLELRCEGKTQQEIADATGFHRSHINNIFRAYFEKGLTAISEKHYRGNRRNMSVEEEAELLAPFLEKAEKGEIVEVSKIKKAYEDAVGHAIGGGQIYYVLKRHGWRKVMPRSKHPKKASEEVIETSKKLTTASETSELCKPTGTEASQGSSHVPG